MMRAERGEEAAMLLSSYQQAAQRDAAHLRQRRRAIRTLFGVVGFVALFVGCIAVVDVFAMNGNGGDSMTLKVSTTDGDEAMAMEAQFGWNSIGYGWCSVKASTWCIFSKDKQKCKENINCYKDHTKASPAGAGSGSGDFGNVTVGDSSTDAEVGSGEVGSEIVAPVESPTQPLDLPSAEEEGSNAATAGGAEGSNEAASDAEETPEGSSEATSAAEEEPTMGGED